MTQYRVKKGDDLTKTAKAYNTTAKEHTDLDNITRKDKTIKTGQTLKRRDTDALLGTLGDIGRQQQDFTDNINLALGRLKTQHDADTAGLVDKTEPERNRALLEQGNREKGSSLQEDRSGLSKGDSEFQRYINMLGSGLITKKQFEEKFPSCSVDAGAAGTRE